MSNEIEYVLYRWHRIRKYVAVYLISRWEKSPEDILYCSNCYKVAVDIHHLLWHIGERDWIPLLYHPKYLAALCRKCHNKAESNELDREKVQQREEKKIKIFLDDYSDYYD